MNELEVIDLLRVPYNDVEAIKKLSEKQITKFDFEMFLSKTVEDRNKALAKLLPRKFLSL